MSNQPGIAVSKTPLGVTLLLVPVAVGCGGTETPVAPPPRMEPPTIVFRSISAGHDHTCGVDVAGVAFCWGTVAASEESNGSVPVSI